MALNWGNVERFGEGAGIRPTTAVAPGAAPGDGPGRPFPGEDAGGESPREIKAGAHDQAS